MLHGPRGVSTHRAELQARFLDEKNKAQTEAATPAPVARFSGPKSAGFKTFNV